ncbi:MAG: formylglycine-generating enzyme family protein [Thermoguttaceae bacterium]|nr:formylglycine-generating enzyme family protein [Thermoguttaceae bacterium]
MQNKLSRRSFLARGAAGVSLFLLSGALFAKYETETSAASNAVGRNVSGFDEGELAGDRATLTINGVEFAFRYCPAGEFLMGSPEEERSKIDYSGFAGDKEKRILEALVSQEETRHKVTLTRGFWLMETELTQKQWTAIMGENPSRFEGDELPAERISWDDCQELIRKLNAASSKPAGWRFDLPTEAQWEYACRAGTETPFSWGSALNGDKANCAGICPYGTSLKGEFLRKTSRVRSYAPNDWGLYDMCGNVYEWCKDFFGEYPKEDVVDPARLSSGDEIGLDDDGKLVWKKVSGSLRVRRGGGFGDPAAFSRSAFRDGLLATKRFDDVGARLALVSTPNE